MGTMNDHIRVSDADRERVADRLRDHFAEGRLSADELDERIAATLSAKTFAELRRVTKDLPDPSPAAGTAAAGPGRGYPPPWARRGGFAIRRRRPRILPLLLLLLILALVIPGAGWLLVAAFKVVLLFWLVVSVAAVFAALRFRRHVRRFWPSGRRGPWGQWQ
jgi:hypothetical protein